MRESGVPLVRRAFASCGFVVIDKLDRRGIHARLSYYLYLRIESKYLVLLNKQRSPDFDGSNSADYRMSTDCCL